MNAIIKYTSIITLITLSCVSQAEPIHESTLDDLVVQSGIAAKIQALNPLSVHYGGTDQLENGEMQLFNSLIDTRTIFDLVSLDMGKSLTEADAKNLIDWYGSNLGSRISRAEEHALTAEAVSEMTKLREQLLTDKERVSYAKRFIEADNRVDKTLNELKTVLLAAVKQQYEITIFDKPVEFSRLTQIVDTQILERRKGVEQSLILSFLYTYKDFDTAELDIYAEKVSQPPMQKLNSSYSSGSTAALAQLMERYVVELAQQQ